METYFYRNPRMLVLMICLIMVSGLTAFRLLPRLEDPQLTQRFAVVKTRLPGASPERVEALVTDPIEEKLDEIDEIKTYESTSGAEISILEIELKDNVYQAEVDEVWSRVRDKLNDVRPELPPEATDPEYDEIEPRAVAMILGVRWDREQPPSHAILRRVSKDLEDAIRSISGTEETELFGDPEEEIVVEINAEKLSSLSMTALEVTESLRNSDAKMASGQLRSQSEDLLVEIDSEFETLERISNIPIRTGDEGQFTRLSDVATVSKGVAEPVSELALVSGQRAIMIGVNVLGDFRVDQWAVDARAALDEFRSQVPDGIQIDIVFDQSVYTKDRLDSLLMNLFMGGVAVVFVIFLTMGIQSAVLVGTALPLSSLMVLAGMRFMEIPIHQMSVTGLIIALGLLIDNAIVVVDEVKHRLDQGLSAIQAITDTIQHLFMPLLGSTLTTAFAFAPIAMMPGPAGEFVGTIAVSVILALFSSLLVSLTIITTLAGWFVKGDSSHRWVWWRQGVFIKPLNDVYQIVLGFLLSKPWLGVAVSLVIPAIGFWAGGQLQEQFFPPADRDQFQMEFELPSHASLQKTSEMVSEARKLILQHEHVKDVHWVIGRNAPMFYYNMVGNRELDSNFAHAMIQLDRAEGSTQVIRDIQASMDKAFPESLTLARQLEQGPPFNAPIEIKIFGPDLDELRKYGDQARLSLSQVPDVIHSRTNLTLALPKLSLQVDEEQARMAGLTNASIANQLFGLLEGQLGGSILEGTEELPIRVRVGSDDRGGIERILSLDLLPDFGAMQNRLPLESLVDVKLTPETATINRLNGKRVNTVMGYITAGVLPQDVLDRFQQVWDDREIVARPGYRYRFGGESAERDQAISNLMANVSLLTVLMIATLVLSFGSFRLSGMIAVVGMASVGLGLLCLWFFGYPFGFMAIVGTMGLIGIAINDSIVVLAGIQDHREARDGDRKAIRHVVERSSRHVVSTTLTTMAGFTPLLLEGGGFWPPLAISIAGGVAGATLLALVLVPCSYIILKGHRKSEDDTPKASGALTRMSDPVEFESRSLATQGATLTNKNLQAQPS